LGINSIASSVAALLLTSCSRTNHPNSVSGTIETDEVRVASRYGGRVEKIYAQEGQPLTNGQIIAELEASELKARRDQIAAQVAELEAGPRKEELEEAKHSWEALVAELDQARSDEKRAEELFSTKTISPRNTTMRKPASALWRRTSPPPKAVMTSSSPEPDRSASTPAERNSPKSNRNSAR